TSTASGDALAGTTNGLVMLPKAPAEWQRSRNASGGPDVRTLFRDRDGAIWIGTNNGAWRFANNVFTSLRIPQPPSTPITGITSASQGGVWLLYNNWLQRWDAGTVTPVVVASPGDVHRITLAHT